MSKRFPGKDDFRSFVKRARQPSLALFLAVVGRVSPVLVLIVMG